MTFFAGALRRLRCALQWKCLRQDSKMLRHALPAATRPWLRNGVLKHEKICVARILTIPHTKADYWSLPRNCFIIV